MRQTGPRPGRRRRPPTGYASFHRGVHRTQWTWLPSRLNSCLPFSWGLWHLPSSSAPTLPDPTPGLFPLPPGPRQSRRPPSNWTAPQPRHLRGRAVGRETPGGLRGWPVVAIHSGLRGPERTRTSTTYEATRLDGRRDSVSNLDKTLGLWELPSASPWARLEVRCAVSKKEWAQCGQQISSNNIRLLCYFKFCTSTIRCTQPHNLNNQHNINIDNSPQPKL